VNLEPGTKDVVVWLPAGRIPAPPLLSLEYQVGNTALADGAVVGEADAADDGEGVGEAVGEATPPTSGPQPARMLTTIDVQRTNRFI
jgi:hypothetical protein